MYNLTDTYWLGRIGTEQLAAINLVTPMQNIVISFGGGVTVAGVVMIAQYVGAKLDDEARKMTAHIFLSRDGLRAAVRVPGRAVFPAASSAGWARTATRTATASPTCRS
jgi:hypothetical protein